MAFWVPRLERNTFNLIRFEGPAYESIARLHVSPEPDTRIRVFMVYRPLSKRIEVEPQPLPRVPSRDGFVLVEWGGAEMPSW